MSSDDPVTKAKNAPLRLSRRGIFVMCLGTVATGGAVAAQWYNILGENGVAALSPQEAHRAAASGEVLLIDIRRPDEWSRTGIAAGAIPIDMRRADFEEALLAAAAGDPARPVALICARGVRSKRLAARLEVAGFTAIIDVPEGMLGSGAGPGWLRRELPLVQYK